MEKTGDIEIRVHGKAGNMDLTPDTYAPEYLNGLIKRAKQSWKNIDPDLWLHNLRGGYEA